MGLLFQPRWSRDRFTATDRRAATDRGSDRERAFLVALEAVLLGDASRFGEVFTA